MFAAKGTSIPVSPSSPYLIDAWETDDGLPENSATALVQTPDGYLWFGTFNGLVRFDGFRFTVFDQSTTPEMPGSTVVNLHLDRANRLWISTDKGLVRKTGNKWFTYGVGQGWTATYVRNFAESEKGELIIASFDGRLYRVQEDRLIELPPPLPNNPHAFTCYFDAHGKLWAANARFYGSWTGTAWQPAPRTWSPDDYEFSAAGPNHTLLVLRSNQLERFEGGALASRMTLPTVIRGTWQLREDSQGRIWSASYRSGLDIIEPSGEITHFGSAEGLTYEGLRATFEDREGNVWVGTSGGGLMRFKRRNFYHLGIEEGLPDRIVKTVSEAAPEVMVVGTHGGGVARVGLDGASRWSVGLETNAPGYVWSVFVDSTGRIWLGAYEQGLRVLDGSRSRVVVKGEAGVGFYSIFEDSQKNIWAGSDQFVLRVRGAEMETHAISTSIRRSVRAFAENRRTGEIWAGTHGDGLFKFDPIKKRWAPEPLLAGEEIWALHMDMEGGLWIGTAQHGLARLKDGKLARLSLAEGLPSKSISSILDDELGYFWLGSNKGIIRVSRGDLNAVAGGGAERVQAQLFTISDGLPSIECAGGHQPSACRDAGGRLWFATLKGIVWVDPGKLQLNKAEPHVLIEDVAVEGQTVETGGLGRLEIPAGTRRLNIRYSALSLTAPEKVRFQYRTRGMDEDWIDVITRRTAFFTDLQPGDYVFEVRASNNDGVWSEKSAQLAFTVTPLMHQTLWFRLVVASLVCGLTGAIGWKFSRNKVKRELERLAQEREVSTLRTRLASVLENTSDYVAFTDANHRIIYINTAGRKLLSLAPDAPLDHLQTNQFFPDWAYRLLQQQAFPAAMRDGVWEGESALKRADGSEIPVSQVLIVHKKPNGALDFTSTIARDLSLSKAAENALRSSEERFRRIAENLQDVLWMVDAQTRKLTYVSPAYERIWQRKVADLQAERTRFFDAVHPQDKAKVTRLFTRIFDGFFGSMEYRIIRADGEIRWIRDRAFAIRNAEGGLVQIAGIAEDFTERKLQEEQREKLEEQLRQSQKMDAIGQLAGGIAHDFNNLLTIIQGNAELIHAHRLPPEQAISSAREICEASERAANLTRQLLTFSRRQAVQAEQLDLNQIVRDVSKMLQRLIGEHITLRTDLSAREALLNADAGMLEQVIVNLAVNARDAMPGGGTLTISVSFTTITDTLDCPNPKARTGEFVALTVTDTGTGIKPEHLPRLFEPFFTTKEVGKGTGLGLATVFGIVQQHEGWIDIDTAIGKGTSFKLFFPAAAKAFATRRTFLSGWNDSPGTETILLVEDEDQLRSMVKLLLEQQGYKVLEARSGKVALDDHGDAKVDLLLTDMVMPDGITGRALGEILLAKSPELKVIYTSGYSVELVARGFPLQDGVNFLPKPYHPSKLLQMVRNALDSRTDVGATGPIGK
ncbi:MAG TPA: two-component regulator propeller domain-containing protein [Methylomirabilota bacterium]|nr:two-component regulator propeller domain-containing protein [Methylomirabilota bacterium]